MNSITRFFTFLKVSMIATLCLFANGVKAQIDNTITNRLTPPSEVANYYETSPDSRVSDDFNGSSINFNIWDYRNDNKAPVWGMDNNSVYTVNQNGMSFVSIKGINTNTGGFGAGLVSKVPVKYGFYVTKWRMQGTGYSTDAGGQWHPSIWGSRCNFAYSPQGDCLPGFVSGSPRIELDFMEGYENGSRPNWNNHFISWGGTSTNDSDNFLLTSKTTDWSGWKTIGLEYTPEYIRLWNFVNGSWIVTKTIAFTSDLNDTANHISDEFRESVYWILSNKPANNAQLINDNSWFHIDYFYFYEYKDNLFSDNGMVNNGIYNIKSVGSNKYLRGYNDTSNPSGNDAYVTHQDLNQSGDTQKWKFIEDSSGIYKIQNVFSGRFLRAYDPTNSNKDGNNANITVYSNNNWASLKWRVIKTPESSGSYYLQSLLDDSFMRGYDPDGAILSGNGAFATKRKIISSASSFRWKLELISGNTLKSTNTKTTLINKEEKNITNFRIYPNPSSTIATIESQSNQKIISVEVVNSLGQITLKKTNLSASKYILDVKNISKGMYFIKTYLDDGNVRMDRLMVNK